MRLSPVNVLVSAAVLIDVRTHVDRTVKAESISLTAAAAARPAYRPPCSGLQRSRDESDQVQLLREEILFS